jgi:hypothetical protein
MHSTQTFDRPRSKLLILLAAVISFALAVFLWFTGHGNQGIFVGLWVASILSAALAPLIWAAMENGGYNDQQQRLSRQEALRVAAAAMPAERSGALHGR